MNDDGTIDGSSSHHIPRITLDHVVVALDKLQGDMLDHQKEIEDKEDGKRSLKNDILAIVTRHYPTLNCFLISVFYLFFLLMLYLLYIVVID